MTWLSGWAYRRKITISGSSGAGTNYQVLLKVGESSGATGCHFHLDGKSANFPSGPNQGGDLRFTADDGATLLDFWVEDVQGSSPNRVAKVWVKVTADLETSKDIYCYFGNPSATNVSNAVNTFIVGELFPDTTHWTRLAGTWSLVSGEGNFPPAYKGVHDGTTGTRKSSLSNYFPPADFRLLARVKNSVDDSLANIVFRAATPGNDDNDRIWVRLDQRPVSTDNHNGGFHLFEDVNGTEYCRAYYDFDPVVNQWYHWEILVSGTTIKGYLDGTLRWTGTVSRTAAGYLLVQVEFQSGHDAFFDYICIGKYVSPEPAFSSASGIQVLPSSRRLFLMPI
jgi:hypothetical protein